MMLWIESGIISLAFAYAGSPGNRFGALSSQSQHEVSLEPIHLHKIGLPIVIIGFHAPWLQVFSLLPG